MANATESEMQASPTLARAAEIAAGTAALRTVAGHDVPRAVFVLGSGLGSWAESLEAIDRALAARDLARIMTLARSLGATYAVVNWLVEDAAYHDEYFSVVRVQ